MSRAEAGTLLGERYELESLLGAGGMGQVFRARDRVLQRPVAVKLQHLQGAYRERAVERFIREARIGAQLSHPHMVRTYDAGVSGSYRYLVMELLEGKELYERIDDGPLLLVDEIVEIGRQVADAMALAHAKGLVHRDLKPENIMLLSSDELQCKVIDFGMAIELEPESLAVRLTREGALGGTPVYMAPEALCGREPAASADVYAFGCVLYHMLCAEPPYVEDSLGELAAQHLYAPIPSPRRERPDCPAVLAELVQRCLQKEPGHRPSMASLRDRLDLVQRRLRAAGPRLTGEGDDEPAPTEGGATPTGGDGETVASSGPVDMALRVALASASIDLLEEGEPPPEVRVMLALNQEPELLRHLAERGLCVLADADPGDRARIAELLRAGVFDVIARPVDARQLVRKTRRALDTSRRRAEKEGC